MPGSTGRTSWRECTDLLIRCCKEDEEERREGVEFEYEYKYNFFRTIQYEVKSKQENDDKKRKEAVHICFFLFLISSRIILSTMTMVPHDRFATELQQETRPFCTHNRTRRHTYTHKHETGRIKWLLWWRIEWETDASTMTIYFFLLWMGKSTGRKQELE